MKIHPLHHGFSFHPSVSSYSFSVLLNRQKLTRAGVDELAPLLQKQLLAHVTISYALAVNSINRCDFLCVLYS